MKFGIFLQLFALATLVTSGMGADSHAKAQSDDFRLVYLPSKKSNYVCLSRPEAQDTLEAFKAAYSAASRPHTAKVARGLGGELANSWASGCAMIEARFVPAMPLDVISLDDAKSEWGGGQEHVFVESMIRVFDEGLEDWVDRGRGYVLLSTKVVARRE